MGIKRHVCTLCERRRKVVNIWSNLRSLWLCVECIDAQSQLGALRIYESRGHPAHAGSCEDG